MIESRLPDFMTALPEIWLAGAAMLLLLIGVFRGNGGTRMVSWLAVVAIAVAFVMVAVSPAEREVTFAGMFVSDSFAKFAKELVLIGSAATIIM